MKSLRALEVNFFVGDVAGPKENDAITAKFLVSGTIPISDLKLSA